MDLPLPLLEFDPSPTAVIEPKHVIAAKDVPDCAVICFFQDVIQNLVAQKRATLIHELRSDMGIHPVYEIAIDGRRVAVFHPGIGAPFAAALMEEVIGLGCTKFVACGACGVLDSTISVGHVLIPNCAVRDEGTSFHYAPPSREIEFDPETVGTIEKTLQSREVPYRVTKTWTTDAFYRETPRRVATRRSEGCLCVEMEAAALCAVARFRGVKFGQLLSGGDDLGGELWDARAGVERRSGREQLFTLAVEACLALG
ncbi:MAG TPA: nucleoside phosphorylase [Capsulimonadaceae bacterium]|jgi:uridine phosphorylase